MARAKKAISEDIYDKPHRLVIVESPNKIAAIEQILGPGYVVVASVGHVRDLPNSAKDIPAKYKGQKWARLGVDIEHDFTPLYVNKATAATLDTLKKSLKNATEVLLASDEDREGEAIAWHLVELLKPKVPIKRMRYNSVTADAINQALNNLSDINMDLVCAQEARRIVDRLYGYMVSPVLWQKMVPNLSAGRVQSVVVRLLVDRERERMSFVSGSYYDIVAEYKAADNTSFTAQLATVDGQAVAASADFDESTGKLKKNCKAILLDEKTCLEVLENCRQNSGKIAKIITKPKSNHPYPPFTTSTLQQEGARKLHLTPAQTMRTAQTLFENGFITYMRTDSTNLSPDGIEAARKLISQEFGKKYLPNAPRYYANKVKNAQEAHEAIRPAVDVASSTFYKPEAVTRLGAEAVRLYELIYKRTIASQMEDAALELTTLTIEQGRSTFKASGRVIKFPGYMMAYVEDSDDPAAQLANREKVLPLLQEGQGVVADSFKEQAHVTQPPARYTYPTLVGAMETTGIGRPSTWSNIIDLVVNRTYAFVKNSNLIPTFLGMAVVNLLEKYFSNLVDYTFTAKLEEDLDQISNGEIQELDYLKQFYFGDGYPGLQDLVDSSGAKIDPREVCGITLGQDKEGRTVEVRIGRFGLFLSNGESRCSLAADTIPDELSLDKALELLEQAGAADKPIGVHPESGLPIYVKTGRFGPYVQMGDKSDDDSKKAVTTAPLLKGMKVEDIDLPTALGLLSLPRTLGIDESGNEIIAANGRFGPFIRCGQETRSLSGKFSPVTITLEEAVALLKTPKIVRTRTAKKEGAVKADNGGRLLGIHPVTGVELRVKDGRYGPYITDGQVNATVPKDRAEVAMSEAFTLAEALPIYDAKVAKVAAGGPVVKKRTFKRKTTKK